MNAGTPPTRNWPLEHARREAARRGITLTAFIEQGLRLTLRRPLKVHEPEQVALPECRVGGGVVLGIHLDDSAGLLERMGRRG